MLSQNDREYIKLLYDNFLKINEYIKSAIEKEDFETIENIFSSKNNLIKQIVSFEKVHQKEIKEDSELYQYKLHLINKEKENIELIENLRNSKTLEFSKINKTKKLYNAYEPGLNETRSTFDFREDDE